MQILAPLTLDSKARGNSGIDIGLLSSCALRYSEIYYFVCCPVKAYQTWVWYKTIRKFYKSHKEKK